ncbi:hypothetical protein FHG87_000741 [Trinorchestia longiramus]|nr:hypothetical protein FHG87_000741 [Trinorchestia longiramus]
MIYYESLHHWIERRSSCTWTAIGDAEQSFLFSLLFKGGVKAVLIDAEKTPTSRPSFGVTECWEAGALDNFFLSEHVEIFHFLRPENLRLMCE